MRESALGGCSIHAIQSTRASYVASVDAAAVCVALGDVLAVAAGDLETLTETLDDTLGVAVAETDAVRVALGEELPVAVTVKVTIGGV